MNYLTATHFKFQAWVSPEIKKKFRMMYAAVLHGALRVNLYSIAIVNQKTFKKYSNIRLLRPLLGLS